MSSFFLVGRNEKRRIIQWFCGINKGGCNNNRFMKLNEINSKSFWWKTKNRQQKKKAFDVESDETSLGTGGRSPKRTDFFVVVHDIDDRHIFFLQKDMYCNIFVFLK